MRAFATLLTAAFLLAPHAHAASYKIEKAGRTLVTTRDGQLFVTVQFRILRGDGQLADNVRKEHIVVEEDGRRVTELEIHRPDSLDPLTAFLALDISGSMAQGGKMEQARQAARLFLDRLHARTDCGLLFFDHVIRPPIPPVGDPNRIEAHRQKLREFIGRVRPTGGTAYLDATAEAVEQLRQTRGRRAVVVMTDGVDLNSQNTLGAVIKKAQTAEVSVYTVGVGEAGRLEPVTTVLVLDCSGSMNERTNRKEPMSKLNAMKLAAARFVQLMRPGAKTTLLPFSGRPQAPGPFSEDKPALVQAIASLRATGSTALYDAANAAVETLLTANPRGKKAIILLTDGKDTDSRSSETAAARLARQAGIPLHVLGFGSGQELNEDVLRYLAEETGGAYHHAQTSADLNNIFERLSIQLHDDGIDQESLRELADQTGGKFLHARDVADLNRFFGDLAVELQTTYTVTFPSRRPTHDGTSRGIDISVVRDGVRVSDVASFDYNVHGVVVPEMDHGVYLALLAVVGVLLAAPAWVRRLHRAFGG